MGLFSKRRKDPDLEDLPPEAAAIVDQLRDVFPDAAISVDDPSRLTSKTSSRVRSSAPAAIGSPSSSASHGSASGAL